MEKSPVEVWLWLLLVMQPHNPKTNEILKQCGGDATAAARKIRDGKFPFINEKEKKRAEQVRMSTIRPILEQCRKHDIRIVTLDDDDYPKLLREIKNPPILLFACGNIKILNERISLAAVGTRDLSKYGKAVTELICSPIAKVGVNIVSGLAVGADTAAHRAALDAGGLTVGVLACGMFVNYPTQSADLKREIILKGGVLISELLPTARVYSAYFHQRNRIISGLCSGTLVTEAGGKSGSLITAEHAVEQGRDVFCIPPHDIFSSHFEGVVPLLREGAIPVFGYSDILDRLLAGSPDKTLTKKILDKPVENVPKNVPQKTKNKPAKENAPEKSAPDPKETSAEKTKTILSDDLISSLDPNEAAVIKILAESPSSADVLMERSGLNFSALSEAVANLEILGYIERGMDGVYSVVYNNDGT